MEGEDRVSREEMAALQRRLAALEAALGVRAEPARVVRCRACQQFVPGGNFCQACGAQLAVTGAPTPTPLVPPAPAPRTPMVPEANAPASAPLPGVAPRAATPPAPRTPAPAPLSVERMLGERWAPRIGAGLVFLAVLFFLGVAIQRGWIGPLAQLAIATLVGVALVMVGAILTSRRGYGTYPQILEGTGMSVLYATAFVAYVLPYYQAETGLTELGAGLLMALVALATVGLALWRDARIIAGLGYGLAFLTALLGIEVLPVVTLIYVAILGSSLALLVARKAWFMEGVVGSLATGGLFLALANKAQITDDPAPALVALVALVPALGFLWLATRPPARDLDGEGFAAVLTLTTFAWASITSLGIATDTAPRGVVLLAWALVALLHIAISSQTHAHSMTRVSAAISAAAFWLVGAPLAWSGWDDSALLTTATYSAGALILVPFASRIKSAGAWTGVLILSAAAAACALFAQGLLQPPWEPADAIGPWQAWTTLLLVLAPLIVVAVNPRAPTKIRNATFWLMALFGTLWTFALFGTPFLATTWLLLLAGGLVALALASRNADPIGRNALAAAFIVLALAAIKGATFDTYVPEVRLDATAAALQSIVIAAALVALYHVARAQDLISPQSLPTAGPLLIGGSAAVLTNYLLSYVEGGWVSILIGALGVAYLVLGLARRRESTYRYTGFAILGFVIVRVFTIDMSNTDLAIRALVFALLGAILLGIGYAYARMSRKEAA